MTNRKLIVSIFTVLLAAANGIAQVQQPKFLIINSLKEDANYALDSKSFEALMTQPGGIGGRDVQSMSATKERAEKALAKIKQLTDGGTPETEPIQLTGGSKTLGELQESLFAIHRDASKVGVLNDISQAGMGGSAWLEDLNSGKKLDMGEVEVIIMRGNHLQKAVTEAQKLGFPDTWTMNLRGQDYTLPQLKELADYLKTAGGQIQKQLLAELAAKDAPFLAVLTADKLRIFKEEFANLKGMWLCLGPGGSELTTPAAMKSAGTWFTYGNSRGVVDTWHVTGYRFAGDKLTGRISRSGFGLKPPASAFR